MKTLRGLSGAEIVINDADWVDAKLLKNAIWGNIGQGKIPFPVGVKPDLDYLLPFLAKIDGSPEFDTALWPCLVRCTYNKEKITQATFNNIKAREDYYAVVVNCIEVNLGPLFVSLCLQLSMWGLLPTATQAVPSDTPESA